MTEHLDISSIKLAYAEGAISRREFIIYCFIIILGLNGLAFFLSGCTDDEIDDIESELVLSDPESIAFNQRTIRTINNILCDLFSTQDAEQFLSVVRRAAKKAYSYNYTTEK